MKELKKLIDVKSIVTLSLTFVVMYQAIVGKVDIMEIYLIIIGFYFGTQYRKGEERNENQKTINK